VQTVKRKRSLGNVDVTPQRAPMSEIMHFSRQMSASRAAHPADGRHRGHADGTKNKRFRKILLEINEELPRRAVAERFEAQHDPPAVLPGHHPHSELTGRPTSPSNSSPATSSATSSQEQDQGG
jgi:hypothetical protein